jgi:hypothetical protein
MVLIVYFKTLIIVPAVSLELFQGIFKELMTKI